MRHCSDGAWIAVTGAPPDHAPLRRILRASNPRPTRCGIDSSVVLPVVGLHPGKFSFVVRFGEHAPETLGKGACSTKHIARWSLVLTFNRTHSAPGAFWRIWWRV